MSELSEAYCFFRSSDIKLIHNFASVCGLYSCVYA